MRSGFVGCCSRREGLARSVLRWEWQSYVSSLLQNDKHMIGISSPLVGTLALGRTKCVVEHISSRAPFGCSVIQAQTLLLQIPGNILVSSVVIHEPAYEGNKRM